MLQNIRSLLDPYDPSATECDGMTQICHTVLVKENIPHVCMIGALFYSEKRLPVHLWIDLQGDLEGYRVDYRARKWLGYSPDVPHGVFRPDDFPEVQYLDGRPKRLVSLPDPLFEMLAMPENQ